MRKVFALEHSLDTLFAAIAAAAALGVIQTFVIGRHYIIPTGILVFAVLFGNLARYGYRGSAWARHVNFWIAVLITAHLFFALFWSVRYRALLGAAFEPVVSVAVLLLGYLVWQYARRNALFSRA